MPGLLLLEYLVLHTEGVHGRTDLLSPETNLSWPAYVAGQAAYVNEGTTDTRQQREQSVVIRMSSLHLTEWFVTAKQHAQIPNSEISRTYGVNPRDLTSPRDEELIHPNYWLKLLRHNEASLFPDKNASAFFYQRVLDSAVIQIAKGDIHTRLSMLQFIRDLTISHKTDWLTWQPVHKAENAISLATSFEAITAAIRIHIERTLHSELSMSGKVQETRNILQMLTDEADYLPSRNHDLEKITRAVIDDIARYFETVVADNFTKDVPEDKKIDYFLKRIQHFLEHSVNTQLRWSGRSEFQYLFHAHIGQILVDYIKRTPLTMNQKFHLLHGLYQEMSYVPNTPEFKELHEEVGRINTSH